MKTIANFLNLVAAGVLVITSGCVTNVVDEPNENNDNSEKIILNLTAPEAVTTRANSDHKLRFTAKMFTFNGSDMDRSSMQRKELLQGEKGEEGVVDQIVFTLAPGNKYNIVVFADYIPANAGKESDGGYKDYYYNTREDRMAFDMYTTPGESNSKVSKDFFNNENYDCFCLAITDTKYEAKQEKPMVLKRGVAKVRVVDTSGKTGNYDLTASRITHHNSITLTPGTMGSMQRSESSLSGGVQLLNQKALEPDKNGESELFYYYTCSSPGNANGANSGVTNSLSFSLTGPSDTKAYNLSGISVAANFVTKVVGDFLSPVTKEDEPEEQPGIDPDAGNILLNISLSDEEWGNMNTPWSSN
ncbi:MAG: hypothetical protein J1F12_03510 [Muribaculaceae bacterium]|nr:hypothetical protein [Muribaculaceae bacterium]